MVGSRAVVGPPLDGFREGGQFPPRAWPPTFSAFHVQAPVRCLPVRASRPDFFSDDKFVASLEGPFLLSPGSLLQRAAALM